MDVFLMEWKERYTSRWMRLGIADTLETAQAYIGRIHHNPQTLGEWEQSNETWHASVAISHPDMNIIEAYEITRWPVIQPVTAQDAQ